MRKKIYLKRSNVIVRDFEKSDIENKVQWINNSENNQYLHYDIPLNVEKTTEWFYKRDISKRIDCVIEYNSIPVGLIGILNIDDTNQKAEFYISMGETEFKRKGISTIASILMLQYCFEVLSLNKVYLNVDEKNIHARKLYEKVGFICEGVFVKDMFHRGEFINRMRYAIFINDLSVGD